MRELIWVMYVMWLGTSLVYATSVASASPYVAADLVNLPWQQVGAAASLAFSGGAVTFLGRLNRGQIEPSKATREFLSDVFSGAFLGAVVFAFAADQQWTLWRTFVAVAIAGACGGIGIDAVRSLILPAIQRLMARVFGQ